MGYRIIRDIPRPDPDLIERLRDIPASAYAGPLTLGSSVALDGAIKPLRDDMRLIGPAFTVMATSLDHLLPMYAITLARAGDVIVVDAGARTEVGVWGAGMARSAMLRGVAGVVIDGAVVDKPHLLKLELPIFARSATPVSSTWERPGSINVPVRCGGKVVHPGDLVVGDADGVVVVPRSRISQLVDQLTTYEEQRRRWDALLLEGKSIFEGLGLAEQLEKLHLPES